MNDDKKTQADKVDALPVESPATELAKVITEGDPDVQLAILEKKAELAIRFAQALNTILITQTYPEDWKVFGEGDRAIACLSSAGAERVARHFGIQIFEVVNKKEEFTDSIGKGYRYVFEGKASMGDRLIYAQGTYSTRDKFLGYKGDEYRPIEDINENDIRDAAYHIFTGNAIKTLLGLRGIPATRFNEIMKRSGENGSKASNITHGAGTQGGTSADDTKNQQELSKILIDMANANKMIKFNAASGKYELEEMAEISDPLEVAKGSCEALTTFIGKDKTIVKGINSVKALKGQRLTIALTNAKKICEELMPQ
jgi:hypothetical protein